MNDSITPLFTGFEQCVAIQPASDGRVNAKWTWKWPVPATDPHVFRSFAEIIFGQKPWSASTSAALPVRVDQIDSVTASGDYSGEVSVDYTGALSLWIVFTSSNEKVDDQLPMSAVIYVWLAQYRTAFDPDDADAHVTVGGEEFDVYTFTNGTYPKATFVRTGTTPPAHIDLEVMDFVDAMNGIVPDAVTPSQYLADVELGNMIYNGTGETQISDFGVTVTRK